MLNFATRKERDMEHYANYTMRNANGKAVAYAETYEQALESKERLAARGISTHIDYTPKHHELF